MLATAVDDQFDQASCEGNCGEDASVFLQSKQREQALQLEASDASADSARQYALQVIGESNCAFLAASNDPEHQRRGRELCGSLLQTTPTTPNTNALMHGEGLHSGHHRHGIRKYAPPDYNSSIPGWPGGCTQYCEVFMGTCREPNSPIGRYYQSTQDCLEKCVTIPVTHQDVQQGNTMACRAFHAALSQTSTSQTAFHCNHAYVVDPMYICRNAILPIWNMDMRQVVYRTLGPYVPPPVWLMQIGGGETAKLIKAGSANVCNTCKCKRIRGKVRVVSCQGLNLQDTDFEALMDIMPYTVTVLDFSANNITIIKKGAFRNTPILVGLDLASCQITTIESGAFNGLKRLVSLLLDGNWGLDTIPADMLYPTKALVELGLANGAVPEIPVGFFDKTRMLQFATLFGQSFTTLPAELFKYTPKLFLLSTVVTGQNSSLASWPAGVLNGLWQMQQLHLALNGPPCEYSQIPDAVVSGLKEMPELRGFVIWGCPNLVSLPEYLFHRNTKLEVVYIFNGGIVQFNENLFAKTSGSLKILSVDWNNHTVDCAYAMRWGNLYGDPATLANEQRAACYERCGAVCPMVLKTKQLNPGVYVTFGNWRYQTPDPASLVQADVSESMALAPKRAQEYALKVVADATCRSWALSHGADDTENFRTHCKHMSMMQIRAAAKSDAQHHQHHALAAHEEADSEWRIRLPHFGRKSASTPGDPSAAQPSWPGGCTQYCDYFIATCDAPSGPIGRYYSDRADCLYRCSHIPVTSPILQQGNTMACKAFHAALSQGVTAQTAFHCNHAFALDPMYICRNYELPSFGMGDDIRQIVFDTFGPWPHVSGTPCGPSDKCKCDPAAGNATVVTCQGVGLTDAELQTLVNDLPVTVLVLDLSANTFTTIPNNIFSKFENLEGLDLSSSEIQSFEADAFKGLSKLVSLLIDGNSFTTLPATLLHDLVELVELSAANNGNWAVLPAGLLATNIKLEFLSVFGASATAFNELPANLFENTTKLFLLSTVVTGLDGNNASWPPGILDPLEDLQQLHIALNGPPCIPFFGEYAEIPSAIRTGIANMKDLRAFVLWGCQSLVELPSGIFDYNPLLELVYLFNNGIVSFEENLFENSTGHLEMLIVDSNNHSLDCSYAARQGGLYPPSADNNVSDPTTYICEEVCGQICPMVRKAKLKNPGVYVLYGNFREQTQDEGLGTR